MSKRNDITDGIFATTKKYGLVYTEELGWIDLGHAQGQDARILKRKLEQEHFSTYYDEFHDWYFPVDYHQEMGIRKKILHFIPVFIRRLWFVHVFHPLLKQELP